MITNSIIKNFNEKANTEMKSLNLYESRLFGRICYGFGRDEEGFVYIKEDEANVVRMIFDMDINGHSLQNNLVCVLSFYVITAPPKRGSC